MEERKNKYLAISFGILLTASIGLFIANREEFRPEINRDYFRYPETEQINQVDLVRHDASVQLKFENSRWQTNGKWATDMQMIKVLMAVLKQVEPQRPVATSMRDSIRQVLVREGTDVTIWQGGEKRMHFLAGGNASRTQSWFLKDGDTQPYVVVIPGYRVYVSGILELDESGWRDKRIFDFNWRNFRTLRAVFPAESGQDFDIEMKGGEARIANMTAVDTAKLNSYLDAVSLLFAERFVATRNPSIDSVLSTAPWMSVEIGDVAGRTYRLALYGSRRQNAEVFGRLSDDQIVALSRRSVAEITRRRGYFVARRP